MRCWYQSELNMFTHSASHLFVHARLSITCVSVVLLDVGQAILHAVNLLNHAVCGTKQSF